MIRKLDVTMLFRPIAITIHQCFSMCCLVIILCILTSFAHAQDNTQAVDFSADAMEANQDTGIFIATGNVVFVQGKMTLKADRVEYNRNTGQAEASGVLFSPTIRAIFIFPII